MYPSQKTNEGYTFETNRGEKYLVYFTQLRNWDHLFKESGISPNKFYYIGVERLTPKRGGKPDIYIKRTIAYILFDFFVSNSEAILLFNYSNSDKRILSRRRRFKMWFDFYAPHTLLQLFQQDFGDEVTVCALYQRHGALEFDKLRTNIQNLIKNMGQSAGIEK